MNIGHVAFATINTSGEVIGYKYLMSTFWDTSETRCISGMIKYTYQSPQKDLYFIAYIFVIFVSFLLRFQCYVNETNTFFLGRWRS